MYGRGEGGHDQGAVRDGGEDVGRNVRGRDSQDVRGGRGSRQKRYGRDEGEQDQRVSHDDGEEGSREVRWRDRRDGRGDERQDIGGAGYDDHQGGSSFKRDDRMTEKRKGGGRDIEILKETKKRSSRSKERRRTDRDYRSSNREGGTKEEFKSPARRSIARGTRGVGSSTRTGAIRRSRSISPVRGVKSRKIDARDHSSKGIGHKETPRVINKDHDDSGYSGGFNSPQDGFIAYRGRGGFRGGQRGNWNSTPQHGRGGYGAFQKQDGRIADILAKECAEYKVKCASYEIDIQELQKAAPKAQTLKEINDLKLKLEKANGRLIEMRDKIETMNDDKYKHKVCFTNEKELLDSCSARAKKNIKPLLQNEMEVSEIKSAMLLLFHRLEGVDSWEAILDMVKAVGSRSMIEGLMVGLREYLDDMKEVGNDSKAEENSSKVAKVRKISFPSSDGDSNVNDEGDIEGGKVMADSKEENSKRSPKKKAKLSVASKAKIEKRREAAKVKLAVHKEKDAAFNDDQEENLDRQYNEQVLRRAGSPDISEKKATPKAPQKDKKKKSVIDKLKRKNLLDSEAGGSQSKYIWFVMGDVVIKGEQGKVVHMRNIIKKSEKGSRILDKNTTEAISGFKCAFYPMCKNTISAQENMAREGTVIMPKDHIKHGKTVYICREHIETDYESIDENVSSVEGSPKLRSMIGSVEDIFENDDSDKKSVASNGDSDKDDNEQVEGAEEDGDVFEGQSQSLLGMK